MANNEERKSTDVDGSIAGYFFQILLGINALTSLKNDEDAVGIECGADVRVITERQKFISIEAKFHKNKMNRYSNDIVKTIYNFYYSNSNDESLFFVTNVGLSNKEDEDFFCEWNKKIINKNAMILYVKSCILRYCVKSKSKSEQVYEKNFSEYKKNKGSEIKDYIKELENDIIQGIEKYSDYAYIDSDVDYGKFCEKIKFAFNNKLKLEAIEDIEENIKNNLTKNYEKWIDVLVKNDSSVLDRIIEIIMYRYLESTSKNSEIGIDKLDVIKKSKLDVKELKSILENYNEEQNKLCENMKLIEIKNDFSRCELEFLNTINEYGEEHEDELKEIYFNIRNQFFSITDISKYKRFLEKYILQVNEYSINSSTIVITKFLFFLTILEYYNKNNCLGLSEFSFKLLDKDNANNLDNNGQQICYKSSINNVNFDFQNFFTKFILNTYKMSDLYKVTTVIAGEIFNEKHKPCKYSCGKLKKRVNIVINQANISNMEAWDEIYSNMEFKCIQCFSLDDSLNEVMKSVEQHIGNKCSDEVALCTSK
ncbi:hypothetical protein [Clostridium butyricum]|uniref:Uncharacterized protein n=1 Tax=Clostridium butyricum TaxID=1492 RepID=A0A2S7FCG3_CLOBU|nr:hypothetical protein [Clostridium butyricum]KHD14233.1 hypothetical protein OA81_16745 [Clostridium butyricum]PPV15602.1 hypothetical protein AWN73_10980 [Clostridium butyricum]